jgi:hypothetical protein
MTAIGEPERILEIPDPEPAPDNVPDYVPEEWPEHEREKEPAIPAT